MLAVSDRASYPSPMQDSLEDGTKPLLARIDAAITRIERAAAATRADRDKVSNRHDQLRAEIAEAIASLDAVIDRSDEAGVR